MRKMGAGLREVDMSNGPRVFQLILLTRGGGGHLNSHQLKRQNLGYQISILSVRVVNYTLCRYVDVRQKREGRDRLL